MNALRELILKDLKVFAADRKAMVIAFVVPIFIASFLGAIMGGTGKSASGPKKVPLLVVDEDRSEVSRAILEKLRGSAALEPRTTSLSSAQSAVRQGKQKTALVIPRGFGAEALAAMTLGGPKPSLRFLTDPSDAMAAQTAHGATIGPVMSALGQVASGGAGASGQAAELPFETKDEPQAAKGGSDYSATAHAFAGMGVQGLLFFGIEAAMGILRERRLGIWSRLRAAPVTNGTLLLSKVLSTTLLASLILLVVFAAGFLLFRFRVEGSVLGFLLIFLGTATMTATFGLLVAALGRTEAQSRGLSVLAVLTMSMIGGAWLPAFLLPSWLQPLSLALPVRWAVDGFDAMTWRGAGLDAALIPFAALLGFSILFTVTALLRFRKEPQTS